MARSTGSSGKIFTARAPAKVNLVLKVGRRRADGYHDIESLFAPLDLADEVRVRIDPAPRIDITCRCPRHPELDGDDNLAAKAARAFFERFGVTGRCRIIITKSIPITAGLGGGSSDAAAVLRCLARAFAIKDRSALAELALEIGSDVPFFLGDGPAWVRGRGERVSPARVAPLTLILLYSADPKLAIRARDAYRWLDAARTTGKTTSRRRPGRANDGAFLPILPYPENDLEPACFAKHPKLQAFACLLEGQGAWRSIMSGSGPTIFGIFARRTAARNAYRTLKRQVGPRHKVFLAKTLRTIPGVKHGDHRGARFPGQ